MNNKTLSLSIAVIAAALIATSALAIEDAFAGGDGHKKHYGKSQAISQANDCGNGELPLNVLCDNIGSQVQGDENIVNLAGAQQGGSVH